MKIIRELQLSEGQTALELDKEPTDKFKKEFKKWTNEIGIGHRVKIEPFYISEMFGDVDYPAIQFKKGTRKNIKTLVILRWL